MGRSRTDIPFSQYWLGKSIHKSPFRGTFIGPVHIISRDAELGVTRRFSRASSPGEKPAHPRYEAHGQNLSSAPIGGDLSNFNSARKCDDRCCSSGRISGSQQQVKVCPCNSNSKISGPARPLHPGCLTSTSNFTPLSHCRLDCRASNIQNTASFCRDCQPPTHSSYAVHPPVESFRNNAPSARDMCKPITYLPERDTCNHCCYCFDEYPSELSSFATISNPDDGASECSVNVSTGSDRGTDDCRCNHLAFAIPCCVFDIGYVAD